MGLFVSGNTWKNDTADYNIPRTHQYIQYYSNKFTPGRWAGKIEYVMILSPMHLHQKMQHNHILYSMQCIHIHF